MKSTYGTFYEQIAPKVNFAWTRNEGNKCAFVAASQKESGGIRVELLENEGCCRPHVEPVIPVARTDAVPERSAPASSPEAQASEHATPAVPERSAGGPSSSLDAMQVEAAPVPPAVPEGVRWRTGGREPGARK